MEWAFFIVSGLIINYNLNMKYLLRIKGVSECLGIRRESLAYSLFGNGKIDLSNTDHPLCAIKELLINGDQVTINDETQKLILGEEAWFSFGQNVMSNKGSILERIDIRVMVFPLAEEAITYYQNAIEEKYIFDAWDGEFEYLVGLIYELELNNLNKAIEWYMKAKQKRFNFELIRKTN